MPIDPLVLLGSDVFAHILAFLPVRDLAHAELVHTSWHATSSSNRRLWYDKCRAAGVDEADLIPRRHWDVPSYKSGLLEADWRASCLKFHSADTARMEGRFTRKLIRDPTVMRSIAREAGDGRLVGHHGGWETCEDSGEEVHLNHLTTYNLSTGRQMGTLDVLNTECGVFHIGAGYAMFYEHRSPDAKGHNPMVWRTHSKGARLRQGYDKSCPPPRHGGYEFMCEVPTLRNPYSMRFRVDREGEDDAEAVLYAIHPGLVRICHLEDGMRMEKVRIDPDLYANEVFIDDDYIFVMGWSEEEGSSPNGFCVYSRSTTECVLIMPSLALLQHSDNTFLLGLDGLEDQSRPARWGDIPEEVSFATAAKNKQGLGFPDCDSCRCQQWENEVAIAGDDLIFTEACDLYVWKGYRSSLERILRSKVTSTAQRGRWFASLSLCLQAPTNVWGYHECLKACDVTKHYLTCAFDRIVISIDLRTIPASSHGARPETIATTVLCRGQWMDYRTCFVTTHSQVIWTNLHGKTVLTFGFNERW